jgi:signal transduction histidine kinase
MNLWRRLGIRFRLALLYSGIFAIALTVFCGFFFKYFENSQEQAFNTTLFNFAVDMSNNLEMDFIGRLFVNSNVGDEGKVLPFHLGKSFLQIRDPLGRVLFHSLSLRGQNLPFDLNRISELKDKQAIFDTIRIKGLPPAEQMGDLRLLTYWAFRPEWMKPLILQIAVPMDFIREERKNLIVFFLVAIPVVLLTAAAAGILMSRLALKSVQAMTQQAALMGAMGKLSDRVPVPAPDDEIRELAQTFNALLSRLERAFNSQERFISNASHQLKTPLTILKGELSMIKRHHKLDDDEAGDVRDFLVSASSEVDHMIKLVEDLLMLARLDAGKDSLSFRTVALDEILLNVVSRIQKIAIKKNVEIHTSLLSDSPDQELDVQVRGDEELLSCLFENLIENAVKYTQPSSIVTVQLRSNRSRIEMSVCDQGPGIAQEDRRKIFERFHRGCPSSFVQGSGLGLAIASEIAELHGVEIQVDESYSSGSRIVVVFHKPIG